MYRQSNESSAIRRVQDYLYDIHLFENIPFFPPRDGIYGEETRAAIKAFQARSNLQPTGIVDLITFNSLRDTALKYSQINNDPDYLYSSKGFPLKIGVKGADIDVLHALLRSLAEYDSNFPPIPRSSYFSAETENAIRYMQRIFRIEENGVVSARLFERLEKELQARRAFADDI